ncbi:carboxymuconolactone decarboxylase family protein [Streptomyces sp. NPDC057623]|uniref:carboxymuconolactone decarboxylase family protein n=1 Tax=Streptomyces sp. NPDC057623 TaxID=3346187 RepID=UPI0036A4FD38
MSRIARLRPTDLTPEQSALYQEITGGPRAAGPQTFALTDADGGLEGPFNAMLLHPEVGHALQQLGSALRYRGTLSDRARELAILIVAADWQSRFEQYAHERVGRRAGLTDQEMGAVRDGIEPTLDDPEEVAVVRVTRLLLKRHGLTDEQYAEAVAALTPPQLFELTALVGYYGTLALQMRVFGVD